LQKEWRRRRRQRTETIARLGEKEEIELPSMGTVTKKSGLFVEIPRGWKKRNKQRKRENQGTHKRVVENRWGKMLEASRRNATASDCLAGEENALGKGTRDQGEDNNKKKHHIPLTPQKGENLDKGS